jgi:hypothetical protein
MEFRPPSGGTREVDPETKRDKPAGFRAMTDSKPSSDSPYYQGQAGPTTMVFTPVKPAGFSPWLLAILAALGVGGYLWYRSRKKKKG